MGIELATTQPVRRPGVKGIGPLPPDRLGLTLRERLWVARISLATIALSVGGWVSLALLVPETSPSHPADPIGALLAVRAELPVGQAPRPRPAVLPVPEARPGAPLEPAPIVAVPAPAPAPRRPVQIVRNPRGRTVVVLPNAEEAIPLDQPQPLAPHRKVEYQEPPRPPPEPAPQDELKRPSFE